MIRIVSLLTIRIIIANLCRVNLDWQRLEIFQGSIAFEIYSSYNVLHKQLRKHQMTIKIYAIEAFLDDSGIATFVKWVKIDKGFQATFVDSYAKASKYEHEWQARKAMNSGSLGVLVCRVVDKAE